MTVEHLTAEVVFDRSLAGTASGVVTRLAALLTSAAPEWADTVTVWSPNPRERHEIRGAQLPSEMASAVERRTKWAHEDHHTGNVEFRGSSKELNVVVSVNDSPLARVGGRLLMANGFRVTVLRKKVAGAPRADWLRSLFHELCSEGDPVWGAMYSRSEYDAKVMGESAGLRAIGRDFSRYIPGVFSVNYFGEKYVHLIGDHKFEVLDCAEAHRVGSGWVVDVTPDPLAWDERDALAGSDTVMSRLGVEFFFRREHGQSTTRAPEWSA